MTNWQTPTAETYTGLDRAFDHFNKALFEERLPPVVFTLTRKRNTHGYFWAEQFAHRADGDTTHEIALNPNTMSRDLKDVLSTLVHEMTHLEQQEFGKPSKNGHHNKEWVKLMERVGTDPDRHRRDRRQTDGPQRHACDRGGRRVRGGLRRSDRDWLRPALFHQAPRGFGGQEERPVQGQAHLWMLWLQCMGQAGREPVLWRLRNQDGRGGVRWKKQSTLASSLFTTKSKWQ